MRPDCKDCQWQPISSAPEDTPILIYAKLVYEGEKPIISVCKIRCDGKTITGEPWFGLIPVGYSGYEMEIDFDYKDITHWMPLPMAP